MLEVGARCQHLLAAELPSGPHPPPLRLVPVLVLLRIPRLILTRKRNYTFAGYDQPYHKVSNDQCIVALID